MKPIILTRKQKIIIIKSIKDIIKLIKRMGKGGSSKEILKMLKQSLEKYEGLLNDKEK